MNQFVSWGDSCHALVLQKVYCVKVCKVSYNKEKTWFRSCTHMNGVMIDVMLLMQNVESNPGPAHDGDPVSNLYIRTYKIKISL